MDPGESAPPLALTWGEWAAIYVGVVLNPNGHDPALAARIFDWLQNGFGDSLTLEDFMGLYDREPNFEEHFSEGDRMVLTGMTYVGKINTRHGEAEKVFITAVTRESYARPTDRQVTYSAIGAGFAQMAQRATAADFPHVAEYIRVPLADGKSVKRFAKIDVEPGAWCNGDDGPPLTDEQRGGGADQPTSAPSSLGF